MSHEKDDPRHCGLDPLTTGDWDPYEPDVCNPHDGEFNALKDGKPKHSNFVVARNFIEGATKVALKGLYAVVAYPLYVTIGGIGGMLRWRQLEMRNKHKDDDR